MDEVGRIRIDDWEMRSDVQKATQALMDTITEENVQKKADVAGFRRDFMETHGFDVEAGANCGRRCRPFRTVRSSLWMIRRC
ncbi:hypothetical protein MASR2M78_10080 [Treponema sp.]